MPRLFSFFVLIVFISLLVVLLSFCYHVEIQLQNMYIIRQSLGSGFLVSKETVVLLWWKSETKVL